jgi:hypothetical protein
VTALLLAALAQFSTDVFENPAPFKQVEARGGYTLSQREVKGSPYLENRVEITTRHSTAELCEAIFEWGTREGGGPGVTSHRVLVDGDTRRVVYTQVSQPVVSNRDFALTVAREQLDEGRCRIRFRTTNDQAPPKPDGFVRMEKLWGEWLAEPLEKGGAKLTHTMFSDPGGAVPPFLVHGVQRSSTRDSALRAVEKTKAAVEKGKAR